MKYKCSFLVCTRTIKNLSVFSFIDPNRYNVLNLVVTSKGLFSILSERSSGVLKFNHSGINIYKKVEHHLRGIELWSDWERFYDVYERFSVQPANNKNRLFDLAKRR